MLTLNTLLKLSGKCSEMGLLGPPKSAVVVLWNAQTDLNVASG